MSYMILFPTICSVVLLLIACLFEAGRKSAIKAYYHNPVYRLQVLMGRTEDPRTSRLAPWYVALNFLAVAWLTTILISYLLR